MDYSFTVSGGSDPVTLAEAKAQMRVLHSNEDALIERIISAASRHVENRIGRNLVKRTVTYKREGFPRGGVPVVLPRPPVISITSITFVDPKGDTITLSPNDYFLAASLIEYWVLPKTAWPLAARGIPSVTIVYESGYGAMDSDVPEDLRHAVLLLVQHFYAHRSAVMEGPAVVTPMAVDALIEPHKTTGWI
ncbi:phiE125 gp8 hypothetical protein [Hyphomicrobium denitrificans ATCC 51888]|uniref:Phage gp6-like head-tail connector protein n=1 Tax=Hyphomicrobium denitrificans (strain ATCC 51888 / DSM 1869 / NCIMB 11706 / TK 0415) TaxID=582899 RepID=D8JVB4_HYPDA|nr:head-tail connector protein [Hyphomicrobium denitrificans]ADJ24768.1 phiE125 gp8 hypothetical protein [Hyphomicrobium denitrificans ATCC 51888]